MHPRPCRAIAVLPAEALLLGASSFRLGSYMRAGSCAVGFTKAVTARYQSNGFFVIHRHATKGLTNILGCCYGIRLTFRAFRVDVDQTHGGGSKRIFEFAVTGVTLVSTHPSGLRTPINVLVRFPNILTSAGETEGFESH